MRALIVTLLCAIVPLLIIASPHVGVMAYYWLSFMTPAKFIWGGLQIPWTQVVAICTLIFWLFSREKKAMPLTGPTLALGLLFLWTCITTIFAKFPAQATEHLIDFTKVVLMTFVTIALFERRNRLHALVWLFVLACGYHTAWSGLTVLLGAGKVTVGGPPSSLFPGENPFARLCIILIPMFFFLFLHSKHQIVRLGLALGGALTVLAMMGTGSRGGLIGFVGMAGYYWLYSKHKVGIALAGLAAGLVIWVATPDKLNDRFSTIANATEVSTAQQRFAAWQFGFKMANERPLIGGGFETYLANPIISKDGQGRAAHSNYFEVLGEHGYVGLILYLSLFFALFRANNWTIKNTKGTDSLLWEHDLARMLQLCLVGYLVGGITINQAFWEPIYMLGAMMISVGLLVGAKLRPEHQANQRKARRTRPARGRAKTARTSAAHSRPNVTGPKRTG